MKKANKKQHLGTLALIAGLQTLQTQLNPVQEEQGKSEIYVINASDEKQLEKYRQEKQKKLELYYKNKGLTEFVYNGVSIWALNAKNLQRKIKNLSK
jgi:hypothetical protein